MGSTNDLTTTAPDGGYDNYNPYEELYQPSHNDDGDSNVPYDPAHPYQLYASNFPNIKNIKNAKIPGSESGKPIFSEINSDESVTSDDINSGHRDEEKPEPQPVTEVYGDMLPHFDSSNFISSNTEKSTTDKKSVLAKNKYFKRKLKLTENDEKRLLDELMWGYDRNVRPVLNASHAVVIQLGITLTQIFDMDEKNQVLTTNVWLDQEWVDQLLSWDPADYNGLETVRLPCERIWLPDIVLYNNADDYTRGYMNSKAMVSHNGKVFWPPPTKFRSTCPVDVTYFPFDDQTCILKLGSWIYDGFQVDVTNRTADVDLTNYISNGEWELLEARIIRNVIYYSCCPEPFPDVTITITIRRKTLYYMYNVVLPCMMMSVLTLLVFCLPPDSGEKIALGVTVLLAFSVFMLAIAEKMPETSESIPLIGIYLTAVMTITSISIIMTVIVLNCHYRGPIQKEVSPWMRRIFLDSGLVEKCRSFTRNSHTSSNNNQSSTKETLTSPNDSHSFFGLKWRNRSLAKPKEPDENNASGRHSNSNNVAPPKVMTSSFLGDFTNNIAKDHTLKADTIHLTVEGVHEDGRTDGFVAVDASSVEDLNYGWREYNDSNSFRRTNSISHSPVVAGGCRLQEEILMALRALLSRQLRQDTDLKRLNEWRTVAIAVDRILFWVFFVVTTVSSVVFLLVLPLVKRAEYVRST
ncbi:neuronal acetylcholine receptor subunit alpha-5-like [Hyalella azteca]|uniref:Neuronal acetylcholine receptor subunit alpha-5-like n=1 Tax=Hyalella azteca TaxID=294128 RepID=A0A8B7NS83_HYAAZ|nr:neuronal acetylcholine receptor subunit alpha-5-like [Hyalella azteca]